MTWVLDNSGAVVMHRLEYSPSLMLLVEEYPNGMFFWSAIVKANNTGYLVCHNQPVPSVEEGKEIAIAHIPAQMQRWVAMQREVMAAFESELKSLESLFPATEA